MDVWSAKARNDILICWRLCSVYYGFPDAFTSYYVLLWHLPFIDKAIVQQQIEHVYCPSFKQQILYRKPKLSRQIKLNHTNIALFLQEATQKYRKLTDYWRKCCYLSLPFPLLTVTCASFAFLNSSFFSSWTQYSANFKRHKWSFVPYIVSFSHLKMAFSKLNLAK